MSKYRKVEVSLWGDAKFRAFSPDAKLIWLYLLTGPRTTTFPGLIAATPAVMADDLGMSATTFAEGFAEASGKGMAKASREGLVVLPKALFDRYGKPRVTSRPESPNVLRAWAKSWDEIPECDLKDQYLSLLESFAKALGEAFAKAFAEAFGHPSPHPMPNQEQEQEQEQEQKISAKPSATRTPRKREPVGETQEAIAHFESRFVSAYASRPTWKGKNAALLAALVKSHGGAEVKRRIDALFESPPRWLKGPFDVGTLSQHFDKLVSSSVVASQIDVELEYFQAIERGENPQKPAWL